MAIIIVLFLTPILIAYFLNYTYWLRRGIPTPLGYPILGNVLDMFSTTHPPPLKLREYSKIFGKFYGITEGLSRVLVVSDVEMINEIFLRQFDCFYGRKLNNLQGNPERDECANVFQSEGYRWKRLRNLSSASFSSNSLRKVRGIVEDTVLKIIEHLDSEERISDEIDMLEIYQEFTMDVIGRIAMGQEGTKIFRNPLLIPVREIFGHNRTLLYTIGNILPRCLAEILRWFMMRYSILGLSPAVEIHQVIREAVLERIRNPTLAGEVPKVFIDLFLDARVDVRSESSEEFSRFSASQVKKNLTLEEIIAQCFVFIVAGFDTASLALAYTSYLLALNPEAMRKAQKEIEEICGEEESISYDQLSKLKYLEAVIKETLRLYPLGSLGNGRKCMKSTEVCGIRIEKDTNILVDTWSVHYDKQIWGEDSNEFRPERWNENGNVVKNGANYLPFGFGPRQCIGMRLAMMEEKLILAHILRKFDFEVGVGTQIPLKLVGRATTQPESLILKLRKRDL